ncbi:MAG TPA: CHAD domain-containing protein [Gaiellaceae bacterium]|nr:CHAD domain-containing protein [Gaiellaceae bacterium]
MAARIERLRAGPGFAFPDLGFTAEKRAFSRTYLDTPDRVLARAGIVLVRHTEDRRSIWRLHTPSHELETGSGPKPPGPITAALRAALAGGAELGAVARLRTRRQSLVVEDDAGPSVRIVDDRVSVLSGRRVAESYREIEVAPLNGGAAAAKVAKRLRSAGATRSSHSELERLMAAQAPTSALPELSAALAEQHAQAVCHDVALRLGGDDEDVHKLRVALRRSRAYLRAARPLLDAEWSEQLREELGWAGRELGGVRDLDVMLAGLRKQLGRLDEEDRVAFRPLLRRLSAQRARARAKLPRILDDERYLAAVAALQEAAISPRSLGSTETLDALARHDVQKLLNRAAKVSGKETDSELHALRIRAKRGRYAAELLDGKAAARFVEQAKELQDLLGEHQDAVVAEERLRGLPKEGDDRAAVLAAGQLVERERVTKRRVRRELPDMLDRLARRGKAIAP